MRRPQVTRSVIETVYDVITLDLTENATRTVRYYLLGSGLSDVKALEKLKSKHETDTLKLVSITSKETKTVTYVMDLEKFVESATAKEN